MVQINAKTAPTRLYAWAELIFFPNKTIGVAAGIQMYFISAVYWMSVWEEKKLRTLKENVTQGIKVTFVRFAITIGLELVNIDAQNVLMMIFLITLLLQLLYFSYFCFHYMFFYVTYGLQKPMKLHFRVFYYA